MVNVHQAPPPQPLFAICYMTLNHIFGTLNMSQVDPGAPFVLTYDLHGIPPGLHGLHIHEFGDTGNNCTNAGAHLNPWEQPHGGRDDPQRHMGDLGNVEADVNGSSSGTMTISVPPGPSLYFPTCIGRTIVLHELEDDLGRGNNAESKRTGNSGKRLSCCTIGLAKPEQPPPQAPHPMRPPPPPAGGHSEMEGDDDKHY